MIEYMKLYLTIIFTFIIANVIAQPYCDVKTFNVRDGLAANAISGMGQDKNQLMWFCSWNGLCCYDGYRFTTFRDQPGKNEVLTTNRILMIKSDSEGDIWCASYDRHIYLFDSSKNKFIDVSAIIKKKYGLDIRIRNIYALDNGYTWITCMDKESGHYRIDNCKIKGGNGIERYSVMDNSLIGNVNKVITDENKREWIFTDKGVQLFGSKLRSEDKYEYLQQIGSQVLIASEDGKLAIYQQGMNQLFVLPQNDIRRINCIVKADHQNLALGTEKGVIFYNLKSHQFKICSVQNPSQPVAEVKYLFCDSRHRIWALTDGQGISMIDLKYKVNWMMAKAENATLETLSDHPFIYEDRFHTIWATPNKGTFSYYDETKKKLIPYVLRTKGYEKANQPTINKYYIDCQGNLWFTSTHDLTLVNFKTSEFTIVPIESNREVRAVYANKKREFIVGLDNGTYTTTDIFGKQLTYLDFNNTRHTTPVKITTKIYCIFKDSKGRQWTGTKGDGLWLTGGNGSDSQHFIHNDKDPYSISGNDIYDIYEDNNHNIWIGCYGEGVNLIQTSKDGKIRFINKKNLLKKYPKETFANVRRITGTKDGKIIVSTTDGLLTFSANFDNPKSVKFYTYEHVQGDTTTLSTSDVMQTLVSRNGYLYIITMSGSLQVLKYGNILGGKMFLYNVPIKNHNNGIIQSIIEDIDGYIWIVKESSLLRYNPKTGELNLFGENDFGGRIEFSEAKPDIDVHTGRIVLGAMNGIVIFNPRLIRKSNYKPNIVFTSVQYQGEMTSYPILYTNQLEVPSDKRNLTISFAALDYHNNDNIQYAFKIEGIDKNWNYTGFNHSASYNRLPAGHYRMIVKSTNADGVWMNNATVLNIYAHPTFWETIWAKILYIIITLTLISGFFYIFLLRERYKMDKNMNDMKTKFFTEIGHKLRTPLTLIGGPITEIIDTERLSDNSKTLMQMVQRNSRNMLDLVNKMLDHNNTRNYFVDDTNAPVFANIETDDDYELNRKLSSINQNTKLLIVEDNDDLRAFLINILHNEYTVMTAENGKIGLETAKKKMPDFIITDVMMPVMDGLTMVHQIKLNKNICHIPIIVLSAKASLDDKLQGLREGIDDYITKPFSATYLKHRVENIISQRKMLQQTYLEQIRPADATTYQLENPQIVDTDKEMMKKLMAFLEENIGKADMKIEDMSASVNLGRTVFYEKTKSIIGMSPVDFVRHLRMKRAEELIAKSKASFSEIAYEVGFSDPKYFGKCFKKETGMTPSEYREKVKTD